MSIVRLPDGSQIVSWSALDGKGRSLLLCEAFWELTDLRRWRGEIEVMTLLRKLLSEDLVAPDLTGWTDHQVLEQIARLLEGGILVRSRDAVEERRGISDPGPKEEAPPPPVKKSAPQPAPAPAPAPVATVTYGTQAEGLVRAAEEGAPFYCECDACSQSPS